MTTKLHNKPAILAHTCPHCRAVPGQPCRPATGINRKVKPHQLRINAAKRCTAPGDCPACGRGLILSRTGQVTHVGRGFECETSR